MIPSTDHPLPLPLQATPSPHQHALGDLDVPQPDAALAAHWLAPWWHACRQIDLGLADLRQAVHSQCDGQPDREEIRAALDEAIREIHTGLQDVAQALVAAWPASQRVGNGNLNGDNDSRNNQGAPPPDLLDATRQRLLDHDWVRLMDNNGFIELRLTDTLQDALDDIRRRLRPPP